MTPVVDRFAPAAASLAVVGEQTGYRPAWVDVPWLKAQSVDLLLTGEHEDSEGIRPVL